MLPKHERLDKWQRLNHALVVDEGRESRRPIRS
jgi:hypothetical protein